MKENFHMQSWAKRGLQTALVTGGLLMLGTGIASADENVSPDIPASPLDLNVNIPIDIADNAVGTPLGQLDVPGFHGEVTTNPVTAPVNDAVAALNTNISPLSGGSSDAANGGPAQVAGAGFTPLSDGLKGNKIVGDVIVPIQITGNALGILGDAAVEDSNATQSYSHDQDVVTDGEGSALAGNAVVLDWALPVQIAGNAGGVIGKGKTSGSASQSATSTGDITTNGKDSSFGGNVVAGQFATPVQVTGNAGSYILGSASSDFDADSAATAGGFIKTDGDGSSASGNAVGAPIALPVRLNGNAGAVWGSIADAMSHSTTDASAGGTSTGINDIPTYIQTGGDDSFLGGNIAAPAVGTVATVDGVAGSWIGKATAGIAGDDGTAGTSASTVESGGFVSTDAKQGGGAGNILNPAVALPVEVFGVAGTYIGTAQANHDNTLDVLTGGGSYTNGTDSALSGNILNGVSASAAEVYGVGGSHIGNATGQATEVKTIKAGGYDGTLGDNSSGSGNVIQVPVVVPTEVFGTGGSFIGQGTGTGEGTTVLQGGGDGNGHDDNGVVSSNLVATPLSVPVQLFGIGGAVIGQGHGKASNDTTANAGGDLLTNGAIGAIAGNIVSTPFALPVQGHGLGGAVAGIASGASDNMTDSTAGGNSVTNGHDGGIAGNIVQTPFAGAITAFGDGGVVGGIAHGTGTNDVVSLAGGDSATNGDNGGISGDIISVDGAPIAQVFGDGAAVGGVADGNGVNMLTSTTGGDLATSGLEGSLSGDILDFPMPLVAQVFGDAVAVGGSAHGLGDNQITSTTSGTSTTAGDESGFSGLNLQEPIGVLVQVYDVALELFGNASAEATDATALDSDMLIDFPINLSELGADQLPALPALGGSMPGGSSTPGTSGSLPTMTTLPAVGGSLVPALANAGGDVTVPFGHAGRADVPAVGALPVQIPTLTALPMLSAVPVQLPTQLPTLSALPAKTAVPVTPQVQVPVLTQKDSSLGFFSKLLASLTGK